MVWSKWLRDACATISCPISCQNSLKWVLILVFLYWGGFDVDSFPRGLWKERLPKGAASGMEGPGSLGQERQGQGHWRVALLQTPTGWHPAGVFVRKNRVTSKSTKKIWAFKTSFHHVSSKFLGRNNLAKQVRLASHFLRKTTGPGDQRSGGREPGPIPCGHGPSGWHGHGWQELHVAWGDVSATVLGGPKIFLLGSYWFECQLGWFQWNLKLVFVEFFFGLFQVSQKNCSFYRPGKRKVCSTSPSHRSVVLVILQTTRSSWPANWSPALESTTTKLVLRHRFGAKAITFFFLKKFGHQPPGGFALACSAGGDWKHFKRYG